MRILRKVCSFFYKVNVVKGWERGEQAEIDYIHIAKLLSTMPTKWHLNKNIQQESSVMFFSLENTWLFWEGNMTWLHPERVWKLCFQYPPRPGTVRILY